MANENGGEVSERKEELLHSIEEDEEELYEAMHELAEATEQTFDLAAYVRTHPLAWVAGAFCMGLWLGWAGSRREPDYAAVLMDATRAARARREA
jgi:ElaB/YqjD/DUF883 family membrane-anchored ribosome-binding protein